MDSFQFFRSYWEAIKCLPDEERLKAYDAICGYALDEEDPQVEGIAKAVFIMAKPYLDSSRKKAVSGSIGGKNGTGDSKQRTSKTQANDKQTASKPQANRKQVEVEVEVEVEKENITPYSPPQGDGFDEFWALYPKKVGKIAAKKAFQRARKTTSLETLLAAVRAQKCGSRWSKDNGDFIPNPATWLNQGRWEDEEAETPKAKEEPRATASDLDEMNEYLRRLTG